MPSIPPIRPRWWMLLGGLLGSLAATLAPASGGCVYHDTCIKVTTPGWDWCRNLALAKMWSVGGSFEDAEPILRPGGASPRGCRCEIDETFARQLYLDPSPLLDDDARLVYDAKLRRHVLHGVEPGSLAHALGLRTGDALEAVGETTISDLDSALAAYARLADADTVRVLVKRGSQWLDFTYTFVR